MANSGMNNDLFRQWDGQVVPRSFNAGFVTLSFVVSLLGAASTLELINRRTAAKGKFNHLLLFSAAVTMGGIAIWCMHYIGNRAIDLADGEDQLQIAYSGGFTALSFFVPIGVLLAAFLAIGTNNEVSWWRVTVGGALAGTAICGMHYLGNASISNYVCVYNIANVVGSALIAVAASIVALAIFFVFRAAWTHSWWKRGLSAILLAGAVSGMHWCASTGTNYRLVSLNDGTNQLSRNTTVIVVICLSVAACFVMGGIAWYTARVIRRYASKAQQVVLAAAVFDRHGRVLVSPDGLLPTERITESFVEKSPQDSFTEAHPLFQWMYRASRNWESISSLTTGMNNHLMQLPRTTRDSSANAVQLINDQGEVIDNYDTVIKELFCTAAVALAEKMKVQLTSVGLLWDEILPTGTNASPVSRRQREADQLQEKEGGPKKGGPHDAVAQSDEDLAEKGVSRGHGRDLGGGSLMFLVRHVESTRDTEALEAAGYRFAELHQVSGIIASTMQIKASNVEARLRGMAEYGQERPATTEGAVQLGLFGVRARVGAHGFDVLVQKGRRNRLPAVPLPLDALEPWHRQFLRRFDRMTPNAMTRDLDSMASRLTPQARKFATMLTEALESLRPWIDAAVFDEATLTSKIVQVPRCRAGEANSSEATTSMIALKIVIPIHLQLTTPNCEFIPLGFFKVQQLVSKDSPHHLAFSRAVHREMLPILAAAPLSTARQPGTMPSLRETGLPSRFRRLRRPDTAGTTVDSDGNPIPTKLPCSSSPAPSTRSGSTLKLWHGQRSNSSATDMPSPVRSEAGNLSNAAGAVPQRPSPFQIMVSQEITVQVQSGQQQTHPQAPGFRTPDAEQQAPVRSRSGSDAGGPEQLGVTSTATGVNSAIELRPMQRGGGDMATFVDELFTACVDDR